MENKRTQKNKKNFVNIVRIVLCSIALLSLISCLGSSVHRGSLSEGLTKSDDFYEGERKVSYSYETEEDSGWTLFGHSDDSDEVITDSKISNENYDNVNSSITVPIDPNASHYWREWTSDWSGTKYTSIVALSTLRLSKNMERSAGFSITSIARGEKKAHQLHLNFDVLTPKRESEFHGSTSRMTRLGAGYHRHRYLTPSYTVMGLGINDGLSMSAGFWSYRNPILSDVYDDENNYLRTDILHWDGIISIDADAGIELHLFQRKRLSVMIGLTGGITLYAFDTFQGMKNDVLTVDGYLKLETGLCFKKKVALTKQ